MLSSKLAWCERILVALEDSNNRLLSHLSSERFYSSMIPATHTFYGVVDNSSWGKFLRLNDSCNHTFPVYLISTSLTPAEQQTCTHT